MTNTNIITQMRQLITALKRHNHAYYVLDNPTISDDEYDSLRRKLIELETAYPDDKQVDSPTDSVGDKPLPAFSQITHDIAMLSLGNVFSPDELSAFIRRVNDRLDDNNQNPQFEMEMKLDGLAVSLKWEKSPVFQGKVRSWYWNINKGFDAEKQDLAILKAKMLKKYNHFQQM